MLHRPPIRVRARPHSTAAHPEMLSVTNHISAPSHQEQSGIGSSNGSGEMRPTQQKIGGRYGSSPVATGAAKGDQMADGSRAKLDPMEIVSRSRTTASGANFTEDEIEIGASVFRSGTVILKLDIRDVGVSAQISEADAERAANDILRAIADARTIRALERDDDGSPADAVVVLDPCPSCGCTNAHVDGCPGDA